MIYGFGWSGQSALGLFKSLGFNCFVVDDRWDSSWILEEGFITKEQVFATNFDIYLVCIIQDEIAKRVAKTLYKQGIPKDKIKFFQTFEYQEKMQHCIKYLFGSTEEVLEEMLKESAKIPIFHSKVSAILKLYYQRKLESKTSLAKSGEETRSKFKKQNVFAILYATSMAQKSVSHIAYPGFNVGISTEKTSDKNFYFIQKIDFEAIKNRPKNIKLVACFGNSALRVEYLPYQSTITSYLQEKLGSEFMVLNFGITGYTVYEQIMLYHALIYPLKPEIVLSFFGGTDFRVGSICDEYLVKTHQILYGPYFYEKIYKSFTNSHLPLYCELQEAKGRVSNQDMIEAVLVRIEQFNANIVGGGGQICCVYPALIALQARVERGRETNAG